MTFNEWTYETKEGKKALRDMLTKVYVDTLTQPKLPRRCKTCPELSIPGLICFHCGWRYPWWKRQRAKLYYWRYRLAVRLGLRDD